MSVIEFPAPGDSPKLRAARQLCSMGLSVLPWVTRNGSKTPTRRYAVGKVLPMGEAEINDWWTMNPTDNVGVITGPTLLGLQVSDSDIIGVDLDTPEAKEWAKRHLPTTPWRTASGREGGGEHWVYRYPLETPNGQYVKNGQNVLGIQGLDIRGKGGYLAVPPSLHASGRQYTWLSRPLDIEDLPEFDPAWFPGHDCFKEDVEEDTSEQLPAPDEAVRAANKWLVGIPPAIEGHGGDSHTFMVAAALRRGFGLSFDQALAVVEPWNELCQPPWSDDGLRRKLVLGFASGTEPMLGRLSGASTDALVQNRLQRAANATSASGAKAPSGPAEPQTMAEAADAIKAARQWALEVPSLAHRDHSVLYSDEALNTADLLYRKDMGSFSRLRQELKVLKVPLKDWERKLRALHATKTVKQLMTTLETDERIQVVVNGDEKVTVDRIFEILAEVPTVFRYGEHLAYITNEGITFLVDDSMHNAVLQRVLPCKAIPDKETGEAFNVPTPLPKSIIKLLSRPLPEQLRQFRRVRRIVKFPIAVRSTVDDIPRIVTDPGYDIFSETLVVSCPQINLDDFPTAQSAVEYLDWVWSDFPWAGPADWPNYLSTLVSLMVRGLIQGQVPMLLIDASDKRSGKSLLAKGLMFAAGVDPPTATNWPADKRQTEQVIFSLLRKARSLLCFDNVRGKVDSTALELMLTSRSMEARILGISQTGEVPCDQLTVMTGNNASFTAEGARRLARSRLLRPVNSADRKFKIPRIEQYWEAHRGRIWAAVGRLVQEWIDRGCEEHEHLPKLEGYEPWVEITGSIMNNAGYTDWLTNIQETMSDVSDETEWSTFAAAWWEKFEDRPVSTLDLWSLAVSKNLLDDVLGEGSERSQLTKLGAALMYLRDSYQGSWQIQRVVRANAANQYKLVAIGQVVRLTAKAKHATMDDVRG